MEAIRLNSGTSAVKFAGTSAGKSGFSSPWRKLRCFRVGVWLGVAGRLHERFPRGS